jgi:membrane protein involved in colicin uptake
MAQPEKRENSVLFSLRELRQIEESRVSEEENAVRNAEAAKLRAKQDEERRIIDAAESKARAIADEQRRIKELELAREHESRLKLEATEAGERARHQAALEQDRLQQEMALRRAEVAKKRPTWMIGVMVTAVIGLAGGVAFAIHKAGKSDQDQAARAVAEQRAAEAEKPRKKPKTRLTNCNATLKTSTFASALPSTALWLRKTTLTAPVRNPNSKLCVVSKLSNKAASQLPKLQPNAPSAWVASRSTNAA